MENLAHSASFHSLENNAPSNPGIKHLGLSDKAAQAAFDFAVSKHWIAAVGDPVFSVMLLEAGRTMIAAATKPSSFWAPRSGKA